MLETLGMSNSSLEIPWGWPASICLGIWSPGDCHTSAFLGIHQCGGPRRSACLYLPNGPSSREADLTRSAQRFDLQEAVMSQPAWDLHPDLGMPGSQVVTVLGNWVESHGISCCDLICPFSYDHALTIYLFWIPSHKYTLLDALSNIQEYLAIFDLQ